MNNDLSWGIPPCFIVCGEADPCLAGSLTLYEMMAETGRNVQLRTDSGIMHAFLHYRRMLDVVYDALWEGTDFIERARCIKKNQ